MKFSRSLFAASLALGTTLCAHAQFGVYGTYTGERVTNVPCLVPASAGGCSSSLFPKQVDDVQGAGVGIYYGFRTIGPARLAADLRGDFLHSDKSASLQISSRNVVRYNDVLAGVRASFNRHGLLQPYVEGAAGWASRRLPQSYPTQDSFAYRGFAGLDVRVSSFLNVRLAEFGIGQNTGGSAGSNTVESVSLGVVFHTPTP